jgi:hypothetical protein
VSFNEWLKFKHRWEYNWTHIALWAAAIIFAGFFLEVAPIPSLIAGFCAGWYTLWLGLKCFRFPRNALDLVLGAVLLLFGLMGAFYYTLLCFGFLFAVLGWMNLG